MDRSCSVFARQYVLVLSGLMLVLASLVSVDLNAASRSSIKVPGWVKPLLSVQHPEGDYLHEDDSWLTLYSSVRVSSVEGGGLRLDYRALYRSLEDEPAVFTKSFNFDEASETLSTPAIYSQTRRKSWTKVDGKRSRIEVPANLSDFVTADRRLLLSTKPVPPGGHVFAIWSLTEKDVYPGERSIFPVQSSPVLQHLIEVKADADVRMFSVTPGSSAAPQLVNRLEHQQVPAENRLFANASWQASAFDALPYAFVTRQAVADVNWKVTGARVRELFDAALRSDQNNGPGSYLSETKKLIAGKSTQAEQITALASFAQSLNYRDVEWGLGAYLPESPSEVLRTRSADCKAKTLLLYAMLREIGVESVPVLARLGQQYIDVDHLLQTQLPAHGGYFNHMVLAIKTDDPSADAARLQSGAGRGWVLFDPTDSLATYGLPPRNLKGTPAVWLDANASVFEVELRGQANYNSIDLQIDLDPQDPTGRATFTAEVSGASAYIDLIDNNLLQGEIRSVVQKEMQRKLRAFMPGAELSAVRFLEGDYVRGQPVSVVVEGTLGAPLQKLTDDLYAFAAPMLLVRHMSLVSASKVKLNSKEVFTGKAANYELDLCCSGFSRRVDVSIKLNLPAAWSIDKFPRLKAIDQPWLQASASKDGNRFQAQAEFRSGSFVSDAGETQVDQRIRDLNRLRKLWRGKFVLRNGG